MLGPASILSWKNGKLSTEQYWNYFHWLEKVVQYRLETNAPFLDGATAVYVLQKLDHKV